MDTMVPPMNGQPGFVVNDNHRDKDCSGVAAAALIGAGVVQDAANGVRNNLDAVGHHIDGTAQRIGLAAEATAHRNGLANMNATERFGLANLVETAKEGHETRDNIDKFGLRNADAIERFGLANLNATKDSFKDLLISTKDDLRDLLISQKNDFKDVLLKSCQVEKDTLLQFKDAQLFAAQNQAILAAQIAECCCENKSLIIEKANATDALVRQLDKDRIQDELARTREELIALRLRATLPPLPVAAVAI